MKAFSLTRNGQNEIFFATPHTAGIVEVSCKIIRVSPPTNCKLCVESRSETVLRTMGVVVALTILIFTPISGDDPL